MTPDMAGRLAGRLNFITQSTFGGFNSYGALDGSMLGP